MTNSHLEFKNVTKKYGQNFKALDDVSFSIQKGEFVFLIGHSGAGKSTVVKLLIKEITPEVGEVLLDGTNIFKVPRRKMHTIRRKIGVVFQDFKVLDSRTVFENVSIALEVVNAPQAVINEMIPNVLSLVGLQDKANEMPYTLSGGEKQRLAIARALAHEPDILVADEPTGMIDPKATSEIVEILAQINKRGTTVIMTTHNQEIVNHLKKRVIKIENGKLVTDTKEGKYV